MLFWTCQRLFVHDPNVKLRRIMIHEASRSQTDTNIATTNQKKVSSWYYRGCTIWRRRETSYSALIFQRRTASRRLYEKILVGGGGWCLGSDCGLKACLGVAGESVWSWHSICPDHPRSPERSDRKRITFFSKRDQAWVLAHPGPLETGTNTFCRGNINLYFILLCWVYSQLVDAMLTLVVLPTI